MKHIDEAIYELGTDRVIRKKGSVIGAIVVLLAGVAMVAVSMMPSVEASENLYTAFVFLGWVMVLAGVIWGLATLFGGSGRAYHVPSKEFLKRTELFFEGEKFAEVADCVAKGDFARLASIDGGVGASVSVVMYEGKQSGIRMCQLFRYIPHNYEPEGDMLIFEL
jgi:hypothetical protein